MTPARSRWRAAAWIFLIGAGYVLAGKLGLALGPVHESATPVRPGAGIALAALLAFGWRAWPAIFLGALVGGAPGGSAMAAFGVAIGDTLEGLLAAALVNRHAGGRKAFDDVASVLRFGLVAGVLAPLVSASIGVTSLLVGGLAAPSQAGAIWLTWWIGGGVGALLVAPPLVLLSRRPRWRFEATLPEAAALVAAITAVTTTLMLGRGLRGPAELLSILILAWAVVRFDQLVASLSVLAIAAAFIAGTGRALDAGPGGAGDVLALLQVWSGVMALATLSLAAAMAERRRAQACYALLASSGRALARSTNIRAALREVATLAIPGVADSVAVFFVQKNDSLRLAIEAPQGGEARSREQARPTGLEHDILAGESRIHSRIGEGLAALPRTGDLGLADHQDVSWLHGQRSCLVVPFRGRERVLGAMAFGSAHDDERYGEAELQLAEDLAQQIVMTMDRARQHRKSEHRASHDSLTALPNRGLFLDRLRWSLEHVRRKRGYGFAVLFFDLDRFKPINDELGHRAGDEILVAVAERLTSTLERGGDVVARIGGDEFAILLDDIVDVRQAVRVATRIQRLLARPFSVGGCEITTAAAIGIAMSSRAYELGEDMVADADAAMYMAKRRGPGQIEVFDRGLRADGLALVQLEEELRGSVDRGELTMHYQPIVSLHTGRLSAIEALVRWCHPTRGLIHPEEFVRVASESDLIESIDTWALMTACRQGAAWQSSALMSAPLSINIAPRLFRREDLALMMVQLLGETGLPAQQLELEVNEHLLASDVEGAVTIMLELKALGLRLAMDDFGTSRSSLGNLTRLPIDTLKIDGSLVQAATTQPHDAAVTRAVIGLAHDMRLRVVAQGVETLGQLEFLRDAGCDAYQGGYFSPALPPAQVEALLSAKSARVPISADSAAYR